VEPQPHEVFEWRQTECGRVLLCRHLGAASVHVFTTRDLNLERPETGGDGWAKVARAVGVMPPALRRVRQIHGARVAVFRRGGAWPSTLPAADVAVTNDPTIAVTVQVADCVPILLADLRTGVVGAAHGGWRGTAAGVGRAAVEALEREFGSRPIDLVAAIGPSVGPCCYEVGELVREAFAQAGTGSEQMDRWFKKDGSDRLFLDLWGATRDQLEAAGLSPERIHVAGLCTMTHRDRFYSYRADGPGTGRMAGAIRMKAG
jgi:YfiH family protein